MTDKQTLSNLLHRLISIICLNIKWVILGVSTFVVGIGLYLVDSGSIGMYVSGILILLAFGSCLALLIAFMEASQ